MKTTKSLTAEQLREVLHYNTETGVFTWRVPKPNVCASGAAGYVRKDGYVTITVQGRKYLGHRLAVLYVSGSWPLDVVDHINGNTSDNRIKNLRLCGQSENGQNRGKPANNTSGCKGVAFSRAAGKWVAQLGVGGHMRYLGLYADINDAIAARKAAEAKYHPFAPKDAKHA